MEKIKDPTIYLKPSKKLINYIKIHSSELENDKSLPKNIQEIMENIQNKETVTGLVNISDVEWFQTYLDEKNAVGFSDNYVEGGNMPQCELLDGGQISAPCDDFSEGQLKQIYKDIVENKEKLLKSGSKRFPDKEEVYVHELLEGCEIVLPQNEVRERNPVLEKRVERLKKEQAEREYRAMTRNVDTRKKTMPEDTIAYQMKMMNRHLIGVAQFVFSVGAGFAFGFIGIELIVGGLDFGFRLLLGIMCALIIALAEIYFLAKHLSEEYEDMPLGSKKMNQVFTLNQVPTKLHKD